jgi:hypothetical protein
MIQQGSRFSDSTIVPVIVHGQAAQVIVPGVQQPQQVTYQSVQVTSSDTIDQLAQRYYHDPTLWWVIADANPEILLWYPMPVGATIRVPTTSVLQ